MKNLFPTKMQISRKKRAFQKNQRSFVIWFTGLSGSGKSTLAFATDKFLTDRGYHSYVLDGDNIRSGINNDLGFSDADRHENMRRVRELSRLFADAGLIVLVSFISPFAEDRQLARLLFPPMDFIEVYINAPFSICQKRDPKGLYAKEEQGEISHFTGKTSVYEPPQNPELTLMTADESKEESLSKMIDYLQKHSYIKIS